MHALKAMALLFGGGLILGGKGHRYQKTKILGGHLIGVGLVIGKVGAWVEADAG